MPKGKGKAAVIEEMDDDLELIEDDEPDEKPVKSKNKSTKAKTAVVAPKAESTGMGASWLAEYVNEELGTEYTAAQIRVVLRKMAADGDLEREVGTDRARYQFSGENDRTVKAVLKRIRSGEADDAKKERLEAARSGKSSKNRKAADEDEAPAKPAKGKRAKASAEEVEEEAPAKPVRRKRAKSDD